MSNIEVGDYVRNKYGEIGIVTKIYPRLMWKKRKNPSLLDFNEIKRHSKNIIDLIEVNDYVNNEIVVDIGERGIYIGYAGDEEYSRTYIDKSEIKSIVTKEQFKEMEYRVDE